MPDNLIATPFDDAPSPKGNQGSPGGFDAPYLPQGGGADVASPMESEAPKGRTAVPDVPVKQFEDVGPTSPLPDMVEGPASVVPKK